MQPNTGVNLPQTDLFAVPAIFVGSLILGFYVATQTPDPLMGLQAWTFMAGVGIALIHLPL